MSVPVIEVVAGIITRDNRLLLAQRGHQSDQPGLWEFPGGKVEVGETQAAALQRELLEELGIVAVPERFIASHRHPVGQRVIHLHAWHVASFEGEPLLNCHQAFAWVHARDATTYPLAPADIPLLTAFMTLNLI